MSPLTTDNRDMVEIETELRARVDAQREAIESLEQENRRLARENLGLRDLLEQRAATSSEFHHQPRLGLRTSLATGLN